MAEPASDTSPEAIARTWLGEIAAAEKDKDRERWLKRCEAILKVYKEQQDSSDPVLPRGLKRYALLWSNIQTLAPAVYSRTPTAVVTRRFKDADPIGRICSEVLERALNFSLEEADFASAMIGCRDEFLLFAQGQAWVRYVPTINSTAGPQAPPTANDQPEQPLQVVDDPGPYDVVSWEAAIADRVHHTDYLHNPARSWKEVWWNGRRVFLTRQECVDRFGPEIGANIPLDWGPGDKKDAGDDQKKAAIYEIWDLRTKTVRWFSKGYTQAPLDSRPDPLRLKGFFPCPKPLFGTLAPDSLIPIPDYMYWQDQAAEINTLTQRIDKLIDALKVRGLYSGDQKTNLNQLLSSDDNMLIPVDSWAALGDKGGLKGIVDWFPLEIISGALKQCMETRDQIIRDVYQITGISDIQRGDTDPDETAAAQKIKVNWGSSRVRERQNEIARFSRDLIRIMGEVIATKFGPDVLGKMTGVQLLTNAEKAQVQQVQAFVQNAQQAAQQGAQAAQQAGQPAPQLPPIPPQMQAVLAKAPLLQQPSWEDVLGVLRDPELRAFRVDIETDSTIEPNDQEEKQRRIEFVEAVGKYLAESLPVVQAAPQLLPVIVEGLKFLVRGFRVGREMEDIIDKAADQLAQAAQSPGQVQPDPNEQAKAQAAQATAQAAQTTAQANVMRAQAHQQQAQNQAQGNAVEMARVQSDHIQGMAAVAAENNRTAVEAQVATHSTIADTIAKAAQRRAMSEINSHEPIRAPTQ